MYFILTAISRQADIDNPVPSICFKPKSLVSGRDFSSLSGTLQKKSKYSYKNSFKLNYFVYISFTFKNSLIFFIRCYTCVSLIFIKQYKKNIFHHNKNTFFQSYKLKAVSNLYNYDKNYERNNVLEICKKISYCYN